MTSDQRSLIADLPGAELISQGLQDYAENILSIPACAVRIAQPRLSNAGLLAKTAMTDITAEHDLYQLLTPEGDRAYSRYNAILREIVSFENALDHRMSQRQTTHQTSCNSSPNHCLE